MPFCSLKRLINNASNPPSGIVEGSFSHDIEDLVLMVAELSFMMNLVNQ